jgi:hypothetical protein
MTGTGEGDYEGAVDPVTAIAQGIGSIADAFSAGFGVRKAKIGAEAEQEAMLYGVIMQGQKNNDTTKILVITGMSLLAVGALIYFATKKR